MKKIIFAFLFLLAFFPSTSNASEWYIINDANLVAPTAFGGFDNETCYYMSKYTATSSLDAISLTMGINRFNTPTDYVYAFLATRSGGTFTQIATSTNWFLGSSLPSGTSKAYRTWFFGTSSVEVASGTDVYFGVRRNGAVNSTNRYNMWTDSTIEKPRYSAKCSNDLVQNDGTNKAIVHTFLVQDTPQEQATSTCPDGFECYTIYEMATATLAIASNTEAIYTVGYTINFVLGIFLFIIFFLIGKQFYKIFIK